MQKDAAEQNAPTLGESLAVFPSHNQMIKRWGALIFGAALIISSIGLTFLLVRQTWDRINIHGRAVILSAFPRPAALYMLMFLVGVLLITLVIIFWQDGIQLFERGLVQLSARKNKTWIYKSTTRFDSHITQITFAGSLVSTHVKIILEDQAGQRLVIRNRYKNMPALIETLRATIVPLLIEKSRQRLRKGEDLVFHKDLKAHQGAITINGEDVPYEAVEITVENQALKLHQAGDLKKVYYKSSVYDIQNLDVLINLLENPPKDGV
jgi:hypothetical protein